MHQVSIRYNSLTVDQLLSDLNWVIQSEHMLDKPPPNFGSKLCFHLIAIDEQEKYYLWYSKLKKDPAFLLQFFDLDEQLILGKYFERLLLFFFRSYSRYEIIENAKQLFIEGITIGEIDFLLFDRKKKVTIHFEVAVKYYLCYKNSSKQDMWIGPNGKDTLSKKINTFSRQLLLSDRHNELIDDIVINKREALLKGYLFQHIDGNRWPDFNNERREKGKWMYFDEMSTYLNDKHAFLILPKSCWLSFYLEPNRKLLNKSEIIVETALQLELVKKGIMLVSIDKKDRSIIEKMMILPRNWPFL